MNLGACLMKDCSSGFGSAAQSPVLVFLNTKRVPDRLILQSPSGMLGLYIGQSNWRR